MNIKDAIKFLEYQKTDKVETIPPLRLGINDTLNNIITLLQQGEKYKQMWEKFKNRSGHNKIDHIFTEFIITIEEAMESYEQKYLKETK